ncbi:MAG: hypothetical protein WBC33_10085, partial [Conexibacter sp.]
LATGQRLADVWPYVRNGAEVVAGYPAAMGTADPYGWAYAAAPALVALALGLAWDAGRGARPRIRWGLLAVCVVYIAFNFKEGFVRMDEGHLGVFFANMLALFAVLPLQPSRRPLMLGGAAAGIVAFGVLLGAHVVTRTLNPYANVKAAGDQVRTLASAARRDALTAELRSSIAAFYAIPPQLVDRLRGHRVMFWPYDYGEIAYAHDLDMQPLPTLESYATYTPTLDRLGARMLASSHAPERILRANAPPIDERHLTFEAPLTLLEILCRYRPVTAHEPWQVLVRTANRCGTARTLRTATASWGESIAVPKPARPGALVLARVENAGTQGLERLTGLLLRPDKRWITLDGERFRLVPATAADGLLLHAPPRADYPEQFALAPNPVYIAVGRDGSQPGGELRYTFVEIPIRRFPAGARAG